MIKDSTKITFGIGLISLAIAFSFFFNSTLGGLILYAIFLLISAIFLGLAFIMAIINMEGNIPLITKIAKYTFLIGFIILSVWVTTMFENGEINWNYFF